MITRKNRPLIILQIVAILLLIPFVAMQFSDEVNWNLFDFVIMGILLLGTGFIIELVMRKFRNTSLRIVIAGIVLFALFLIWAELAVGVFGTPFAGS